MKRDASAPELKPAGIVDNPSPLASVQLVFLLRETPVIHFLKHPTVRSKVHHGHKPPAISIQGGLANPDGSDCGFRNRTTRKPSQENGSLWGL